MKVVAFLVLLAALPAAAGNPPLQNLDRIMVSGSEYVRLEDWANDTGFYMRWEKQSDTITLSRSPAHVVLTANSRRAEISGANVFLSLPVVNRNGAVLISLIDLETTIDPILFPQKSGARLATICLDPGHGGKDTGEIAGHNFEKTYTLLLARELEPLLEKAGFKVVLTRHTDEYIELPARTQLARREGADLFMSLHYNSAKTDVGGLEVFCLAPAGVNSSNEGGGKSSHLRVTGNAHDEQNVLLAYEMQKAISAGVPLEDRGMKRSRFEVLREAAMPAILIEGGFMSNPSDARKIYDGTYRKRMAQAIVNGILAYKRALEPLQERPPAARSSLNF